MINEVLKNIVYLYYPKTVCYRTDENKYINSEEHKRLLQIFEQFHLNENMNNYCANLKYEFEKDLILKKFRNQSMIEWQDRSISFDFSIIENSKLYTITLYLSILIPFYTVRVQKNKIEMFSLNLETSKIDNNNPDSNKIKDITDKIEFIVESKMLYKKFPQELLSVIIEDVSFQEIQISEFNMFNAFFNNQLVNNEV